MPWRAVLLAIPLLLLAACSDGDDDDVVVAAAEPTATATATQTAAPSPTATASATAASARPPPPASDGAVFCEATIDGRIGYLRQASCATGENGFVTGDIGPAATVAIGEFVPQCLQPVGEEGMIVVVGTLCTTFAGGATILTADPLPAELRATYEDGVLIPWCRIGNPPDWPIETGPPCIQSGVGPALILLDVAVLEAQATCAASLSFIFVLINPYLDIRDSIAVLQRLSSGQPDFETNLEAVAATLRASRDQIVGLQAAERVVAFFESWADQSPLVIRLRTLELLDPLLAALASSERSVAPVVDAALVDHVDETLLWYVAGRGC